MAPASARSLFRRCGSFEHDVRVRRETAPEPSPVCITRIMVTYFRSVLSATPFRTESRLPTTSTGQMRERVELATRQKPGVTSSTREARGVSIATTPALSTGKAF